MVETGKYAELKILRIVSSGAILDGGKKGDILLPGKQIPEGMDIGDIVSVFIYRDHKNRPIATTKRPYATVDKFAFLKVKDVSSKGIFLDWGLSKDLFLSKHHLHDRKVRPGDILPVYLVLDANDRILATTNINKYIHNDELTLTEGAEVNLSIFARTDLGWKVIVNSRHWGILYKNEVFEHLNVGDQRTGYVTKIRTDHKLDIRLTHFGHKEIEKDARLIMEKLQERNGFLNLNDKSAPEKIYETLGISKKAFKRAVGHLLKDKLIQVDHIGLKKHDPNEPAEKAPARKRIIIR
jgi:predicted RNA-binding protein (virulence factor B family)